MQDELLRELNNWRDIVIKDKGVTEEFRKGGWPADYPTRLLEQWEQIFELWKPWVFHDPEDREGHPREEITRQLIQ